MIQEHIEGNKLIAEFMGWKYIQKSVTVFKDGEYEDWQWEVPIEDNMYNKAHLNHNLYFHTSWDWLMPVRDKIISLACNVNIINNYCQIIKFESGGNPPSYQRTQTMAHSALDNTYNAIVQFIKWYNNQHK